MSLLSRDLWTVAEPDDEKCEVAGCKAGQGYLLEVCQGSLYIILVVKTETSEEQSPNIPLILLKDGAGSFGTIYVSGGKVGIIIT